MGSISGGDLALLNGAAAPPPAISVAEKQQQQQAEEETSSIESSTAGSTKKKSVHSNGTAAVGHDVFSRLNAGPQGGRGVQTGWTVCPLCVGVSSKRYALGRGISAHLHAVHSPWLDSKIERKKKRKKRRLLLHQRQRLHHQQHGQKQAEEEENKNKRMKTTTNNDDGEIATSSIIKVPADNETAEEEFKQQQQSSSWEPTLNEIDVWNAKVIEIVQKLDAEATASVIKTETHTEDTAAAAAATTTSNNSKAMTIIGPGYDRNGREITTNKSYSRSLPPFIQAAADGDIETLREMVKEAQQQATTGSGSAALLEQLVQNTRDRHGSTAHHWAAGGGHLQCLKYLLEITNQNDNNNSTNDRGAQVPSSSSNLKTQEKKKIRRRDGKTSLHYAARNGHVHCLRYLLEEVNALYSNANNRSNNKNHYDINERSGDGTTPLHMACFGGHVNAVKFLLERGGADATIVNDWGCNAAHWTGLTRRICNDDDDHKNDSSNINSTRQDIYRLCKLLQDHGVSFVESQNQGHSALHKAAQRRNRYVIEWVVGSKEDGCAGLSKNELLKASEPDDGGHRPSDIWIAAGGGESFASWMREEVEKRCS